VATASSSYGAGYPVSAINNNQRTGAIWGSGGGWADATPGQFPDDVEIEFNGRKTIDRVVVYTVQDNYQSAVEPTDSMTFSRYGVTHFTVQGWDGGNWVVLATVSGNNLVKRTVTFPAFTTEVIRIHITGVAGAYSTLVEVEAWGVAASALPATTTTLASSANPASPGAMVQLTATVLGATPTER
jgi:hypothetical protein